MTYQEFLDEQEEFIQSVLNGTNPDEYWFKIPAETWCDTPSCIVYMQVFPIDLPVNVDKMFRVYCGRCNTPVHNVYGLFEDGTRLLNTTVSEEVPS